MSSIRDAFLTRIPCTCSVARKKKAERKNSRKPTSESQFVMTSPVGPSGCRDKGTDCGEGTDGAQGPEQQAPRFGQNTYEHRMRRIYAWYQHGTLRGSGLFRNLQTAAHQRTHVTLPIKSPYSPMEALSVEEVPVGAAWQYEPKWDGFRCLVFRDETVVELQSKSGRTLTRSAWGM